MAGERLHRFDPVLSLMLHQHKDQVPEVPRNSVSELDIEFSSSRTTVRKDSTEMKVEEKAGMFDTDKHKEIQKSGWLRIPDFTEKNDDLIQRPCQSGVEKLQMGSSKNGRPTSGGMQKRGKSKERSHLASGREKIGNAVYGIFNIMTEPSHAILDSWTTIADEYWEVRRAYSSVFALPMDAIQKALLSFHLARAHILFCDFENALKELRTFLAGLPSKTMLEPSSSRQAVSALVNPQIDAIALFKALRSFGLTRQALKKLNHCGINTAITRQASRAVRPRMQLVEAKDTTRSYQKVEHLDGRLRSKRVVIQSEESGRQRRRNETGHFPKLDGGNELEKYVKKREAVEQRSVHMKVKFVKHEERSEAAKKRSLGSAQLDDQSAEERELPQQVPQLNQDEPQRKKARAINCLLRRRKLLADRKRRELEIEKTTVSSDEENLPVRAYHRRKSTRCDDNKLNRKRIGAPSQEIRESELFLDSATLWMQNQSVPVTFVISSFRATRHLASSSADEDSSLRGTSASNKYHNSETVSEEGYVERITAVKSAQEAEKSFVQPVVSSPNISSVKRQNSRKKLSAEADDIAKRVISDYDGGSRKRRNSLHCGD